MRISSHAAVAAAFAACVAGALAVPASGIARPGTWGGYDRGAGWGAAPLGPTSRNSRYDDPREGRVQVSRFVAEGESVSLLGHGPVTVTSQPAGEETGSSFVPGIRDSAEMGDSLTPNARASFEAAVVDRLVAAGYDTLHANPAAGQRAELRVSRVVLTPAEGKRNPVSGTAAMEVGSLGSAYGLGVNVDMTKPRAALVSTRLEAQIRDVASDKVLWEGHAQIAIREGDAKWSDGAIASRLAEALFDGFKHSTDSRG